MRSTIVLLLALAASPPVLAQVMTESKAEAARAQARAQGQAQIDASRARTAEGEARNAAARAAADESRQRAQQKGGGDSEQEQLAIAALEGLISAPHERAFPLIKRVLASNHSDKVKARALFVLSQMDRPDAQELLLTTAKTGSDKLRGEAIRMIGIGGDDGALGKLREIYASGDKRTRRDVLQAYLIAGRKQDVLQIVLAAKSEEESDAAVQMLAAMGAVAELRQLGDSGRHSKGLVQAYAVSGDLESLRKIADGNAPIQTRADAVQSIGIIGGEKSRAALRELYRSPHKDIKDAALQGMLISGDEKGLLELYRASTVPAEKRELLRTLTMVGGDAAIEAIDAALQGKSP